MRFILDSCTIIYLVKGNVFQYLMDLTELPIVIDTSVFSEVVTKGKQRDFPDATEAEELFNRYKIPIIPNDISEAINIMKDAGESSCYLLAKEKGLCITSDIRAYKKFKKEGIRTLKLEAFFWSQFLNHRLSESEFIQIITALKSVNGISSDIVVFYMKNLYKFKNRSEDK